MIEIKAVTYTEAENPIKFIRETVFQVEQNVPPELEFDEHDKTAEHLLAYLNNQPVGTCRWRYLNPQTAKIERLAVLAEARRQKIGQKLMEKSLEVIKSQNCNLVVLNAQEYVKPLYEKIGFHQVGDRFEEAGISHIKMIKKL